MGLPVLEASLETQGGSSAVDPFIMNVPAGIVVGELLILICGSDSSSTTSWGPLTGWTLQFTYGDSSIDTALAVYSRVADGTEGTTLSIPTLSQRRCWGTYQRWSNVLTTDGTDGVTVVGAAGQYISTYGGAKSINVPAADSIAVACYSTDGSWGWPTIQTNGTDWPGDTEQDMRSSLDQSSLGSAGGVIYKEIHSAQASEVVNFYPGSGTGFNDGICTVQFAIQGAPDLPQPTEGYPTIGDLVEGSASNAGTTVAIALPPNIEAGDGLLMLLVTNAVIVNNWNGFTELSAFSAGSGGLRTGYKKATGLEGGSVDIVFSNNTYVSYVVLRYEADTIAPWDVTPPESDGGGTSSQVYIFDPPSLTASWGQDFNLWLAVMGVLDELDYTVKTPANFAALADAHSTSNQIEIEYRAHEVATEDPSAFEIGGVGAPDKGSWGTYVVKPSEPLWNGLFDLSGEASLAFDGEYIPTLFTGQFSLDAEAAIGADGFFFEDQEGDLNLAGVAALSMTGETEPPVFNSWFDLTSEAALDFDGVAEVFGEFSLGAEATIGFLGSYIPVGGGAAALYGVADITFTGEFTIPDTMGDVALTAEATVAFTGQSTAPVFTGQFILGAVASISGQGTFLSEAFGEFSLEAAADFGIWAQVPLQPGTGSSVKGDRATPTRVWSLEDPSTVEGEDDPTRVKGRQ